jgi:hypothetical protein
MTAVQLAQLGCGGFFITGLSTGIWKYRCIITSPDARAPVYVDICHRTSLMYAFACLVLAEFAHLSAWPDWVNAAAVGVLVAFFASAVLSYAVHGVLRDTDNQLQRPHRLGRAQLPGAAVAAYMTSLIIGEVGAFLVLFTGFVASLHRVGGPG